MSASQRINLLVALMTLLVVSLAVAGWLLQPAGATIWFSAVGTIAAIWLILIGLGAVRSFDTYGAAEVDFLQTSVLAAGALLVAALAAKLGAALGYGGGEFGDRALGVCTGAALAVLGNKLPKVLTPLAAKRCAPAQVQSLQRFTGAAFFLDGLVCASSALLLPIGKLQDWILIATLAAMLAVALRYAWAIFLPPGRSASTGR